MVLRVTGVQPVPDDGLPAVAHAHSRVVVDAEMKACAVVDVRVGDVGLEIPGLQRHGGGGLHRQLRVGRLHVPEHARSDTGRGGQCHVRLSEDEFIYEELPQATDPILTEAIETDPGTQLQRVAAPEIQASVAAKPDAAPGHLGVEAGDDLVDACRAGFELELIGLAIATRHAERGDALAPVSDDLGAGRAPAATHHGDVRAALSGRARDDVDETREGVRTIHGRRGSTDDLDALDVVQADGEHVPERGPERVDVHRPPVDEDQHFVGLTLIQTANRDLLVAGTEGHHLHADRAA